MTGVAAPYAWDPHPVAWAVLTVAVGLVVMGHRHLLRSSNRPIAWTRRQIGAFAGACVALVVALTWPVADLAAHWTLTALVTQRMILILAVAPLLLLGLPYDVLRWLTRSPAVDSTIVFLKRPQVAIITVTSVLVCSMTPVLVRAQASSPLVRALLDTVIVLAGFVLWIPVLGRVPGILRLKPVVRFGYLVAQAIIPAFLSFVLIFSIHPLYRTFAHSRSAIGLGPLTDQQIAGFVSKLSMLFVLLSVAAVVLTRAPMSDDDIVDDDPLLWADVERQFERADRSIKRRAGRSGRERAGPPPSGTNTGTNVHRAPTPRPPVDSPESSPRPWDPTDGGGPRP